ncbi:MAG: hypothetical protein R3257_02760 [bacterium]|nr:hypothetical protein [bacterium]
MRIPIKHLSFIFFFFSLLYLGALPQSHADIQSSLRGTWKSGCINLGSNIFIIITSTYDGAGRGSDQVVYYRDPACTSPTGLVKTNSKVSYTIGKEIKLGGDRNAYEFNVTILAWQLTQNGSLIKSGTNVPTQFDIIAIKDNKLYNSGLMSGRQLPSKTPGDRPTTLDLTNFMTRQ